MIRLIIFDFGGVVAEEGFREGLGEIGRKNGVDPDLFFSIGQSLVYESGYVTGQCSEEGYWDAVRKRSGITETDHDLREEVLKRFIVRPRVLSCIDRLRSLGFRIIMLSDQTNWLDEINEKISLFRHFDRVFNSFHLKRSKRDPFLFSDICREMGVAPQETLFIDDNENHTARASGAGLNTIRYAGFEECKQQLEDLTGAMISE